MRHLDELEIYDTVQSTSSTLSLAVDNDFPNDEIEEHLEVCEKCQRGVSEMREFFIDIYGTKDFSTELDKLYEEVFENMIESKEKV